MKKQGLIYIWYDRKYQRFYIGCHWGTETDGYICSSSWMKKSFKKRPQDFKKRYLKKNISTRQEMFTEEQRYLNMIKPNEIKHRYYNLNIKNNEIWSKYDENIKTISEKISIKTKEAMNTPEVRERYLQGLAKRNNKSSDLEVREKRSKSMKGKNAGKITVKFATGEGKAFHVTKDDPRLLTGEVVSASKGVKRNPHTNERKEHLRKTSQFHVINSIKKKCNYCEFIGVSAHLARYHNDKCKNKSQYKCLGY